MGRRPLPVLTLVVVTLAVLAVPTAASAATGSRITDVVPAPGGVTSGATTSISATLASDAAIGAVTFEVDGRPAEFELLSTRPDRARLRAALELEPGHHVAAVEFRDGNGHVARRIWRFGVSGLVVARLAGADRIATAARISLASFPGSGSASAALIARASDFPDALAAAPLATQVGGPLLLTPTTELAPTTRAELVRVLPPGATVYLLGGRAALDDGVRDAVAALGFEVERIAGDDRAATAAAVAALVPETTTAIVASGVTFPDALAAAAAAARDGLPILLTGPDSLSPATAEVLRERGFAEVVVVGGTAAVTDAVATDIARIGPRVTRLAGADRFATAAAVVAHFGGTTDRVVVASGVGFADALAGGPYAGRRGYALLLSPGDHLAAPQTTALVAASPSRADVIGGEAALTDDVVTDLHRTRFGDPDGPLETGLSPARGSQVNTLDTIDVAFDEDLDLSDSWIHVTIDGREILGRTLQADFADRIVFQPLELPFTPEPGIDYPLEVTVLGHDGAHWRHLGWRFTYRKLDLGRGDSGPVVRGIQDRLIELGYWLGTPDASFGYLTSQAIMAFQKYEGLPRTGEADAATRDRLASATRPVPKANNRSGRWVEIDKTRQVMLFNLDGRVEWAFNTSTGTETYYNRPGGGRALAHTPEGWFTFNRQIDGLREAPLGRLWRPKYFTSQGHAIHGSNSVPAHPASHGCARLSNQAIDFVWSAGLAPLGTPLWVYV